MASPAGAACLVSGEWIGSWDATLDATGAAFSGSVSSHLALLAPSKNTLQLSGRINFATGTTAILNDLPITADPTSQSSCHTVKNGRVGDPKNPRLTFSATITPSGLHVPPRPTAASQSVCGGPPEASIFFSLPPAKKPM